MSDLERQRWAETVKRLMFRSKSDERFDFFCEWHKQIRRSQEGRKE